MEEKNNNIRCCDCIYSMGYDEWGRGTYCKAVGEYTGVYNKRIECKNFKNKKEQCYMSKIYRLYFLEEGRARLYGLGGYEYIMELLHDYIKIHDIYGEDKIDFRIEKVTNKIFSKEKFKNGLGIEFSNVEEFVDVIDKLVNIYNFKKEDFYFDLERECDYFSEMNNKLFEKKRIIFYDTDGSIDWHVLGWDGEVRETISYEDFMKE